MKNLFGVTSGVALLFGVALFVSGLFDFSHDSNCEYNMRQGETVCGQVAYYYSDSSRKQLTFGSLLVVFGLLGFNKKDHKD